MLVFTPGERHSISVFFGTIGTVLVFKLGPYRRSINVYAGTIDIINVYAGTIDIVSVFMP